MLEIFHVTAPFFLLILCGYLAARFRLLPPQAVPALNVFVLYFALPCMLFRFGARTPFAQLVNAPVFFAYATAGIAMLVLFGATARFVVHEPARDAVYGALATAWSNWGYMGFALLPALLGPRVAAIIVAAGLADLLVVVSGALACAALASRRGGVRPVLFGMLRNPLVWAIVAGGAFSAAETPLPHVLDELTRLLGEAAVPVALFTIGVSLYRPGTRIARTEVFVIAGAKLLVHPYVALLIAATVFRLEPLEVRTLALAAALPCAGTAFLFAERGGANAERIAAAILVSTVLAFFSFAALSWAFGVSLGR
jgi:malonate transporter